MGCMTFHRRRLAGVTAGSAALAAAVQGAAWIASRKAGRVNVVDVAWGPGLAGIAVLSAFRGDGDRLRRGLLASAVTAWGARLAMHVHRSAAGRGEDPRYEQMLQGTSRLQQIAKVFGTQGAAQWLISLPIQVASVSTPKPGALGRAAVLAGTALMVGGGLTEAIADRQKATWKREPDHGPVMDRGLWAWSRHPNYFGDACLWWGVYLVAAAAPAGRWTVLSPAVMTWFLTQATGARRSEQMRKGDPDYAAYQQRVSFFIPRPPNAADCCDRMISGCRAREVGSRRWVMWSATHLCRRGIGLPCDQPVEPFQGGDHVAPVAAGKARKAQQRPVPHRRGVPLLDHAGASAVRVEQVTPDVAIEMPPGDPVWLVEFDDGVGDPVAGAEFHVHAELGAQRQPRRVAPLGGLYAA